MLNTYIMSVSASTFLLQSMFPFEQELRTARVLRKHFWCSSTFRTKTIHIHYVCFCQHILVTISIFPFEQELRTARVLRKYFWCFSTFTTMNIHIYHVCFCQHILATIDIPFRARIAARFKKAFLVFSPARLERSIFSK